MSENSIHLTLITMNGTHFNKKVFIGNSTGIKNYPVSVNKVIS